ncbi:(NiFe) hydrogenase maturation protein HypF [Thermoplasmatales archaeon SCGC AB-539-N05]|nr:(NiFe) hydrogenase maturation protein HypF [Thermoplasmatales archaeon SCGC AB-539-N05]
MKATIKVTGIVQGIGFRPFVYRIATENKLTGYVLNVGDAGVHIVIEGTKNRVKCFLDDLEKKKPPLAWLDKIKVDFGDKEFGFTSFNIKRSNDEKSSRGSVIPPDISICDECLREITSKNARRYDYFFTTCTNCGPRYTTIVDLPYDRIRTSMNEFPMCERCKKEYSDPSDRRFHAQTIACPICGPKAFLTDNKGNIAGRDKSADAIRHAGRLLVAGKIVAIKGNGGFHVGCSARDDVAILRLRKTWERIAQPFALMARDIDAVKSFARVSLAEEKLLKSYVRPIVVLNKKKVFGKQFSSLISPNLHNVGVMLPYTGLHYLLFQGNDALAFVMTSANAPGDPMIIDNDEAIRKLADVVDYFLFYNRRIVQRCDDSVVKFVAGKSTLLRRSRGYVPTPIHLSFTSKKCVLALGPDLGATSCVLIDNKAFLSQHIGNTNKHDTLQFLRRASEHLLKLTNAKPDVMACDLHPEFETTHLARKLGEEMGIPVIQVQHHHAHLAALLGEYASEPDDEIIGIAADGIGYGNDGTMWGGEILRCSFKDSQRVMHFEEQPMIGGDLATRYPLRMLTGILGNKVEGFEDFLFTKSDNFPHKETEINLILQQLKDDKFVKTSSCGRVLDAVSALLGVCYERTYEGEPAMKLESAAVGGKDVLEIEPHVGNNVISTTNLLQTIWENRSKSYSVKDLAFSAHTYIARSLARAAIDAADSSSIELIGFSGGCAYNEFLLAMIKKEVESHGFTFLQHRALPSGDGGISIGQALVASSKLRNVV